MTDLGRLKRVQKILVVLLIIIGTIHVITAIRFVGAFEFLFLGTLDNDTLGLVFAYGATLILVAVLVLLLLLAHALIRDLSEEIDYIHEEIMSLKKSLQLNTDKSSGNGQFRKNG
jgi:hypothetical protein